MTKNRDLLGALALLAALVATASAEYELARACGFGALVAGCIPGALDVYALRAFSVKRDVPAVVVALISTNALAHLVASHLIPVSVPLVVAVSAIAPLVLWRVKALSAPLTASQPAPVPAESKPAAEPVAAPVAIPPPAPVKQPAHSADPLLATARKLQRDAGKVLTLRALQTELRIGQSRAQRIRVQLAGGAA
ncbi:hypothetical protein OG911_16605 [Streptomyces sp. NBC_00208]|uniref:hypothetical protein n=1 Tax=Streptomyces sp. NBC_00208 TaxID=2975681 RepID=UPI002E2868C8|nr:hypothetical protein [Streptomyces sp. NBC_00208]